MQFSGESSTKCKYLRSTRHKRLLEQTSSSSCRPGQVCHQRMFWDVWNIEVKNMSIMWGWMWSLANRFFYFFWMTKERICDKLGQGCCETRLTGHMGGWQRIPEEDMNVSSRLGDCGINRPEQDKRCLRCTRRYQDIYLGPNVKLVVKC